MFFNVFNRALVCAGIFALTACGGGEPIDSTTISIQPASNSALRQSPSVVGTTGAPAADDGIVRPAPRASAAEREADQQRMVPYEQAFAIEMNRRAQERPEHLRGQGEPLAAPAPPACAGVADPVSPSGCVANPPDAAAPAAAPPATPTVPPIATPAQAL